MKYLKIVFIGIGCLLGIVILILLINCIRLNIQYQINKKNYTKTFSVVGSKKGYVPQGMAYDETHNIVLQTSYNTKDKPSSIYIINFKTGKLLKELLLKETDNSDNHLHVGGVATDGKTIWITSDYQVNEYSLEEALKTKNNYLKSKKHSKLPIRGDFCYCKDNNLWIGDFYLKPFYPVPDDNPLLMKYNLDILDYNNPMLIISLPKMVQGMAITDNDEFVFTRSFTYLVNSKLSTYKNISDKKPEMYKLNIKEVAYYHFDETNLIKEETIPPMAEGIFYKDKSLYILFESDSDHYALAFPKIKSVLKKSTN